jgi:diguanylate cyclase (GGDEF)-like protein
MTAALVERAAAVVRVLLVEDNDGDARLVELMLQGTFGRDIELSRARTLADGLALLDQTIPDCVVLDLGLPDAHGLEAIRRIKARAPLMAVVVLTGDADGELGTQAVTAGAQDYLVKGNTVDETLIRSIRYAVVRKGSEDALYRSQQTLAEAQHIARLGSWELDVAAGTMAWSLELCRLYGYPPSPAPSLEQFFERLHPEDPRSVHEELRVALDERRSFDLEHRIVVPGHGVRWVRSQGRVESLGTDAPVWMRGTAQDISEQKLAEAALTHQALHDALTGLPNRTLLLDRLRFAQAKLFRHPSAIGLLFIDVDRFKVLNDSLGHTVGDKILIAMAARLQASLRPGDTLARFGGDEFIVLCENLAGESDALAIAARIAAAMVEPLQWGDGELILSVSIGVALTESPHTSAESLLRDADSAMYRAKDAGRARSALFVEPMRARAVHRLDTEVSLRRALDEGQMEVHYQPIVRLASGEMTGSEALVRWRHPTRGLVPPDEFISIAEETGLIVPLGAGVLREAVRQTRAWQQLPGCSRLVVAVNLSAVQLQQPDLADMVAAVLDDTGLSPSTLELEITESVLMDDAPRSVAILQSLKALGVKLSIDDFGTGYSSLSYLKRFPVNDVKIDRSFVDGLGQNPADSAIVAAIVAMAHALDLETIAEGVETTLQMRELTNLDCTYAQGYLFARPQPPGDLSALLYSRAGLDPSRGSPTSPPRLSAG